MAASNAENQDGGAGGGQDGGTCWLRRLRLLLVSGRRRNVRRRRPPPGESLNRGRHLDGGWGLRVAGKRRRIFFGDAAGRLGSLVLHGGGEKVGSEVAGNEEERRLRRGGRLISAAEVWSAAAGLCRCGSAAAGRRG